MSTIIIVKAPHYRMAEILTNLSAYSIATLTLKGPFVAVEVADENVGVASSRTAPGQVHKTFPGTITNGLIAGDPGTEVVIL